MMTLKQAKKIVKQYDEGEKEFEFSEDREKYCEAKITIRRLTRS